MVTICAGVAAEQEEKARLFYAEDQLKSKQHRNFIEGLDHEQK